MNNLPAETLNATSNHVSRQSDQKFCHACAKVLHQSASSCPSCGASQQQMANQQNQILQSPPIAQACYCHGCGNSIHLTAESCPKCGASQLGTRIGSQKSKVTAGVLALLLGGFGAHKFYCGKTGWGIIYLLLFWTWIPMIVSFIEGIMYLTTKSDQEFTLKYCS